MRGFGFRVSLRGSLKGCMRGLGFRGFLKGVL